MGSLCVHQGWRKARKKGGGGRSSGQRGSRPDEVCLPWAAPTRMCIAAIFEARGYMHTKVLRIKARKTKVFSPLLACPQTLQRVSA